MAEREGIKECFDYKVDVNCLPKQIDWEQRRYEIAKNAMIGCLASPIVDGVDPNPSIQCVAHHCVMLADALIEELQKGGER